MLTQEKAGAHRHVRRSGRLWLKAEFSRGRCPCGCSDQPQSTLRSSSAPDSSLGRCACCGSCRGSGSARKQGPGVRVEKNLRHLAFWPRWRLPPSPFHRCVITCPALRHGRLWPDPVPGVYVRSSPTRLTSTSLHATQPPFTLDTRGPCVGHYSHSGDHQRAGTGSFQRPQK